MRASDAMQYNKRRQPVGTPTFFCCPFLSFHYIKQISSNKSAFHWLTSPLLFRDCVLLSVTIATPPLSGN